MKEVANMSDGIVAGGGDETPEADWTTRRLVPMQIGSAIVYIEASVEELKVEEGGGDIYTVSPPSPTDAFNKAMDAIGETVRAMGDRFKQLEERIHPDDLTVEFEFSFDAKGKASIIPVFVTGETSVHTGIKVTATWTRSEATIGS
jgi:Trypsin-co-occurring domain 1